MKICIIHPKSICAFWVAALSILLLLGCSSNTNGTRLVFEKYPNLKLGFTTQNFIECVPVTLENAKSFINYANDKGYSWIELRDPDAVLTLKECEEIAQYAKEQKIEVGYAIQKGLLNADFWETFLKAVKNAAFFDGPKTIRVLACGNEFSVDEDKKGWNNQEFTQLIETANKASQIAKEHGLQLVIENGTEALNGDRKTFWGLADFFEKASPDVGWQFDTANFFSGARIWTHPDTVKMFLENNIGNLFYIHLKTSQKQSAQPVLGDNELDFDFIFSMMSKHNVPYIAIELFAIKDVDEIYRNLGNSITYLRDKGLLK